MRVNILNWKKGRGSQKMLTKAGCPQIPWKPMVLCASGLLLHPGWRKWGEVRGKCVGWTGGVMATIQLHRFSRYWENFSTTFKDRGIPLTCFVTFSIAPPSGGTSTKQRSGKTDCNLKRVDLLSAFEHLPDTQEGLSLCLWRTSESERERRGQNKVDALLNASPP